MQSNIIATTQKLQFDTVVKELSDNGHKVNVKAGWHYESKADSTVASVLITAV